MPSLHVRVSGKVQGVGFRWFVREQARRCELAGWVANRPDGSVEIVSSGHEECIERFRRSLHVGPPGALVESVAEVADVAPPDELPFPFVVVR